jgi:hypothetical protein
LTRNPIAAGLELDFVLLADIDVGKLEHITKESAVSLGIPTVNDRMRTGYHPNVLSIFVPKLGFARRFQAEGLPECSRGSQRSEDPRTAQSKFQTDSEGVADLWHPFRTQRS